MSSNFKGKDKTGKEVLAVKTDNVHHMLRGIQESCQKIVH
jgi:hypothetical protein